MELQIKDLITELEQKFWNNNTFAKHASAAKESVLQTIKAYFYKKDLVIVSRTEYERLLKYKEQDFLKDPEGPLY